MRLLPVSGAPTILDLKCISLIPAVVHQTETFVSRGDLPVLNMDILLCVMKDADERVDMWRVMRTCRTLYCHGIPILLRKQVVITHPGQLRSLWQFLSSDSQKTDRFQYLRSLSLRNLGLRDDTEIVSILVKILQSATHLEHLQLLESEVLSSSTEAIQAVANLGRLRSVLLALYPEDKPEAMRWLQSTNSPISEMIINDWTEEAFILSKLGNLAAYLTTLRLVADTITAADAHFPHLRRLVLRLAAQHI